MEPRISVNAPSPMTRAWRWFTIQVSERECLTTSSGIQRARNTEHIVQKSNVPRLYCAKKNLFFFKGFAEYGRFSLGFMMAYATNLQQQFAVLYSHFVDYDLFCFSNVKERRRQNYNRPFASISAHKVLHGECHTTLSERKLWPILIFPHKRRPAHL